MPLRNLSETLGDAWKKSVENGQKINQRINNNNQNLNDALDNARNTTINHLRETDKGFYRPDTSYYFELKDGNALRRRRLAEQATQPQQADTGEETEEERKKREEAEVERQMKERDAATAEKLAQRTAEKEEAERAKQEKGYTGVADGRDEEARARAAVDRGEATQDDISRAQVRDQLASVDAPKHGEATHPSRTGTRGSTYTDRAADHERAREAGLVSDPGRERAIQNILKNVSPEEEERLKGLSDEELAAEIKRQERADTAATMSEIEAKEAERRGLSVDEYRAQVKARQAKMKEFDQSDDAYKRKLEIEDLEAEAKRLRREGKREESIEKYREASKLRRAAARGRSKLARSGEEAPVETGEKDTEETPEPQDAESDADSVTDPDTGKFKADTPAGDQGIQADPRDRPGSDIKPLPGVSVTGQVEKLDDFIDHVMELPAEAGAAALEKTLGIKLSPEMKKWISRANPYQLLRWASGKAGESIAGAVMDAPPDAPRGEKEKEEYRQTVETDVSNREANIIRKAETFEGRPEVPQGTNPFEPGPGGEQNTPYRKWFSELSPEQQQTEVQYQDFLQKQPPEPIEGELKAQQDQAQPTRTDDQTGLDVPTTAPPTTVASAADQPPPSPPGEGTQARRRLPGAEPVMASYNPVSKYGISLFEAKKRVR